MQTIPIQSVPNQSLSVTIDRQRWTLTIKAAVSSMVIDLSLNDQVVIRGLRIMPNQPLIPYPYLATVGNFLMLTNNEELPQWERFGVDQVLVYSVDAEISKEKNAPDWSLVYAPYEYDFENYADALAALNSGELLNNQTISVKVDETQGDNPTRYRVYVAPPVTLSLNFLTQSYNVSSRINELFLVV